MVIQTDNVNGSVSHTQGHTEKSHHRDREREIVCVVFKEVSVSGTLKKEVTSTIIFNTVVIKNLAMIKGIYIHMYLNTLRLQLCVRILIKNFCVITF